MCTPGFASTTAATTSSHTTVGAPVSAVPVQTASSCLRHLGQMAGASNLVGVHLLQYNIEKQTE
jgi:hypothetical protein